MNKLRVMVFAAVLAGLFCAHTASAQNITVVSGNGQLVKQYQFFSPMTVQVTDSNGVPAPNATVTWTVNAGGFNSVLLSGSTTTTDLNGMTSNVYNYFGYSGTNSYVPYPPSPAVTASIANGASAPFYLFQAQVNPNPYAQGSSAVNVSSRGYLVNLMAGQVLTGQAGTTSSLPIQVFVSDTAGSGVPNVSVQLVSYQNPASGPVVNCAGTAGGEANTVLTGDASNMLTMGLATCYPVFGGVPGTGQFYVLVGAGGIPPADPTYPGYANWITLNMNLLVTAAQPGLIKVTQGNGQSAAPGQGLATPLQVEVDTASGSPVAGQQVNWTVSPAGAATVSSTATSTDATGRAAVNATFSNTASGTVQITATCPACPAGAKSVTFSALAVPLVTISGLQIVSGNNQTAVTNLTFILPLVVQVNASNGQAAVNAGVQFSVVGPATLSSTTATTDSNGRAQIAVQAGATAGAVTVTATVGSFTQTFSLTVTPPAPPAPTLTAGSFYNGADFKAGSISPCSIATIIAPGLAPGIQGIVTPGSLFGPLPYLLASDAVSFNGVSAPIFNVANVSGQTPQITVQVPCETAPGSSVPVTVAVGSGSVTVNVPVLPASPGIFLTTMSDGVLRAVAVRPDGTWVSLANPARRGEIVRAYATGLGVTSPAVGTNAIAIPGTDAVVRGIVIVGITNNAGQGEGVR